MRVAKIIMLLIKIAIFVSCLIQTTVFANDDENPVVRIETGFLRGKLLESRAGRRIYSFTSIPFAEPPLGRRRFEVK